MPWDCGKTMYKENKKTTCYRRTLKIKKYNHLHQQIASEIEDNLWQRKLYICFLRKKETLGAIIQNLQDLKHLKQHKMLKKFIHFCISTCMTTLIVAELPLLSAYTHRLLSLLLVLLFYIYSSAKSEESPSNYLMEHNKNH